MLIRCCIVRVPFHKHAVQKDGPFTLRPAELLDGMLVERDSHNAAAY